MQVIAARNSYMLPHGTRCSARPRVRIADTWKVAPTQVRANAVRTQSPDGQRPAAGLPGTAGGGPGRVGWAGTTTAGTATAGPPAPTATSSGASTSASTRCRANAKSHAYASMASAYKITVVKRSTLLTSASPELTGIMTHSPLGRPAPDLLRR